MTLKEVCDEAFLTSKEKGFHNGDTLSTLETNAKKDMDEGFEQSDYIDRLRSEVYSQLAKLHTEVSELTDAFYRGDWHRGDPSKPGLSLSYLEEEIADIQIRLGHFAKFCEVDLDEVTKTKMAYNRQRAYKHGKKH